MKKLFEILKNKYFRFALVLIIYLLWVIWVGSFWLLIGIPVIFDMYISKKVNWTFWKKRNVKNPTWVEWLDALIFAVIAVTFINIFLFQNYKIPTGSMEKTLLVGDHLYVSKVAFGPKLPNTPIAFPFAQNTMPGTTNVKSYASWLEWPYKRLKGLSHVKNDDIVVFNFPEGDTVVVEMQEQSYYSIVRQVAEQMQSQDLQSGSKSKSFGIYTEQARNYVKDHYTLTVRPVDRRDNYIKRCVAIPGDSLQVINGQLFINHVAQEAIPDMQLHYNVVTDGSAINPLFFKRLGIYQSDVSNMDNKNYVVPLTKEYLDKIKSLNNVVSIEPSIRPKGEYASYIFPHDSRYAWNEDNFGPLWIPKKGVTVKLTLDNICLFDRIISVYEGNQLQIKEGKIFINGQEAVSYTFKMDYYFMMGDNRHDSADSRFWGFVPEDHIVGRPVFIWLSLNKEASGFFSSIRWNRMFKSATH
jgi:signal peptidase I